MAAPRRRQKFGGSSLAGADRIKRVARRIARERAAGNDLVVAVSAMGDTTDELMDSPRPSPRSPTCASSTCCSPPASTRAQRLHPWRCTPLGVSAISLTVGDHHGRSLRQGAHHHEHRATPRPPGAEHGKVVIVAGFQGLSAQATGDDEITTPAAAPTRPRSRLPPGRREPPPDLHRRPRHLHGRSPAGPERTAAAGDRLRGDARARPPGRTGDADPAVELGWVNDVVIEVLRPFEDAPGTPS